MLGKLNNFHSNHRWLFIGFDHRQIILPYPLQCYRPNMFQWRHNYQNSSVHTHFMDVPSGVGLAPTLNTTLFVQKW